MNQFKQIFGSLPRHVPSNSVSVVASGCQTTEGIFRKGRRYLRPCSLPRNVQSATFVDDRAPRTCRPLNDEGTQAFLYGRPKLALFHNGNVSMERSNDLDVPFHRSNVTYSGNPGYDRKTLKTEAYRSGNSHIQSTISSSKSRTYANMIAEYSEAMDKKKLAKKSKEPPKGLFARLPFESVVSSLTKLERTKLSKGKVLGASNSLAANRSGKEPNHPLTDTNVKIDKRKTSPIAKTDLQKREFFTKNDDSPRTMGNDFDFICGYREIENEKENFASKWIRPRKTTEAKTNSTSITIDDFVSSSTKDVDRKFKRLNVLTSEGNIEIKIPVYENLQSEKEKLDSEISAKSREKVGKLAAASNSCVMANKRDSNSARSKPSESGRKLESSAKTSESTNFNKPPKSLTSRQFSSRNNKAILPWWASPDCISGSNNKPRSSCLNDVDAIQVSEQVSQIDESAALRKSSERRKKMTSIGRHIEAQQLEDKRMQEAKRASIDKRSVLDKKPIQDAGSVTKSVQVGQKKTGANSSGVPVGSRVDKKETARKKQLDVVLTNKQLDKNLRSTRDRNGKLEISASSNFNESVYANTTILSKVDKNCTPSIPTLREAIRAMSKKSKKSDRGKSKFTIISETEEKDVIDHRVRRISDALRPIEKKKDGTLIDYGLKVPTRKPKPRRPSEKSTNVKNIPKKTISAPHHQQRQPTTEPKITPEASKNLNPVPQSRSEMPLTKTSKLTSANDRLGLQSKQKPAIRDPVDKNRGKSDGGLGKSDNSSCVGGPRLGKNNRSERDGNCTASSLANGGDSVLTFLRSEQMFDAKNAVSAETNVCENQSNRPEKELIYSAWLNRFHTRKHSRTVK